MENPNQPREYDAVVGGENLPPAGSAILGGIEGVKSRLLSNVEEQRIAALKDAPKYGEAGLDFLIGALQDESKQVEKAAYRLLRERAEPRIKQILQKHNHWQLFERLPIFNGHSGEVTSVAISPDGQTFVSGSEDETIKVWHLQTGELLRTLEGHSIWVWSVAISPDGQTLVSGNLDRTIGNLDRTIKVWGIR
jgi:WD40 repeat protein